MQNDTRKLYNEYRAPKAQLNGVHIGNLAATFSVEPSVQQRLEMGSQESDEFLKKINVFGVKDQEGQKNPDRQQRSHCQHQQQQRRIITP